MSTLTLPETITNGTTLDATEVQSNFTTIESFVNTDVVTVDGGKSFTGAVTLPAASPTTDNHATRKKYVDDKTWDAAHLQSDSVTTVKILDANVTTAKLADASVTTAKLVDSNVTNAKVAAGTYDRIENIKMSAYCGRAIRSTAQAIADDTTTVLIGDSETYDPSTMHNTSNGHITAPANGVMRVTANVTFNTGSSIGYRTVELRRYSSGGTLLSVFGADSRTAGDNSGDYSQISVSGEINVSASDILRVHVYQNSGGSINVSAAVGIESGYSWSYLRLT